jgi:SAM-dependent methyltransferase
MASPTHSAEYFDGWYADKAQTQTVGQIMNRNMGLPADALAGVVSADALPEITAGLALRAGDSLVDVACGRGYYGLVIARETGASLTGIDFSEQALGEARAQAARMKVHDAGFRVGNLTASGLPDGHADAVLCTDSIQFAEPQSAGYAEIARILRPGGRAVLTCWEPTGVADGRLGTRIRTVNLRAGLLAAGFADVDVRDRPEWLAREYAMNAEAAALDAGDDPALRSFRDEGARSVAQVGDGLMRRVLAVATRLPSLGDGAVGRCLRGRRGTRRRSSRTPLPGSLPTSSSGSGEVSAGWSPTSTARLSARKRPGADTRRPLEQATTTILARSARLPARPRPTPEPLIAADLASS